MWDGKIKTAARYNNPAPGHEPLLKITNGTNAYKIKSWEPNKKFIFERIDGYWVKGYVPNAMLTDANEMLMDLRKEQHLI